MGADRGGYQGERRGEERTSQSLTLSRVLFGSLAVRSPSTRRETNNKSTAHRLPAAAPPLLSPRASRPPFFTQRLGSSLSLVLTTKQQTIGGDEVGCEDIMKYHLSLSLTLNHSFLQTQTPIYHNII